MLRASLWLFKTAPGDLVSGMARKWKKGDGKKGTDLFFTNRDLAVILSYNDTGISEHGIFHGITTYTNN